MELDLITITLSVGAGMASIASPCVLPILPIIITGKEKDHKYRPILIITGLTLVFVILGIISSAFGSVLAGYLKYINIIGAIIIISFGVLILFDKNPFKKLYFLSKIKVKSKGRFSGFLLGCALGLIWIPCTGPTLSGILTLVASQGEIYKGIVLLLFYSLGFAIPILIFAYLSQFARNKMTYFFKNPWIIRYTSSLILIIFGIYLLI